MTQYRRENEYEVHARVVCGACRLYKPGKKSQCIIYRRLFMGQDPELVRQVNKFVGDNGLCKSFTHV